MITLPTLTLTWRTQGDERVCPICGPLDLHIWKFDTNRDVFPDVLEANGMIVWDTTVDESRTHGDAPHHCRCYITGSVNATDLAEAIRMFRVEMEQEFAFDERAVTWGTRR